MKNCIGSELSSKEKADAISKLVGDCISASFYITMTILLIKGVLGKRFIINYVAGTVTSRVVKYLIRHNII